MYLILYNETAFVYLFVKISKATRPILIKFGTDID
jgi:hypothetical protein